jgi:branched-chain amino acid transport system permease protein
VIEGNRVWYYVLLAAALTTLWLSLNLLRSRTGRAWRAVRSHETVAAAIGIDVKRAKLTAFVVSSSMTAVAGALFAYWRGFVSAEAFSLFLSIQYVAMIIIGGMGSILGAILGAIFVTLFPYAIESLLRVVAKGVSPSVIFSINHAAFGLVMILFLVFEPLGLVGIFRRIQSYLLLWPFKQKPLGGAGK